MYLCSLMVDVSLIPILEMTYVWFGWYIRKMIVTHHGFLVRLGAPTNLPLTQSQPYFPPRFQVTKLEIFFLLWKKKLIMFKIHNPCNDRVRVPSISAPGGIACRPQRASITFTEESTGLLFFSVFVCLKKKYYCHHGHLSLICNNPLTAQPLPPAPVESQLWPRKSSLSGVL